MRDDEGWRVPEHGRKKGGLYCLGDMEGMYCLDVQVQTQSSVQPPVQMGLFFIFSWNGKTTGKIIRHPWFDVSKWERLFSGRDRVEVEHGLMRGIFQ